MNAWNSTVLPPWRLELCTPLELFYGMDAIDALQIANQGLGAMARHYWGPRLEEKQVSSVILRGHHQYRVFQLCISELKGMIIYSLRFFSSEEGNWMCNSTFNNLLKTRIGAGMKLGSLPEQPCCQPPGLCIFLRRLKFWWSIWEEGGGHHCSAPLGPPSVLY